MMRQAYEENKQFGDPKTIEYQLRENDNELERLNKDLSKHLVLLDDVKRQNKIEPSPETNSSKSPSITNSLNHGISIGQGSELSRTNSENSLRPETNTRDGAKSSTTNRTSNSFADSISDSLSNNASLANTDVVDGTGTQNGAEISNHKDIQQEDLDNERYELPSELPAQAYARALYPFRAEPAGSISMKESELFDVIEFDQGDGWTRVRRKVFEMNDDDFIGFVPTSYISIGESE